MEIIRSLDAIPEFVNPVVTIGSFDGVHLGHRQIFKYMKEVAQQVGGESVIITFEPHPQELLHPDSDFFRINTIEEKIKLIEEENIDYLIVIPFTKPLADMSFTDFFEEILIEKIHVKAIVMGPNHTFGKGRAGNNQLISEYAQQKGVDIVLIPEFMMNDCAVRSQQIRKCIRQQNYSEAVKLLGHDLTIEEE